MIVSINEIKANPKNPRTIKDDKFNKLKKSIEEFPDMLNKRPLVCFTDKDGKYVVLGGNMRLKASKEIGLKELPIMLADEWTEEQKAEFLIKDNVGFGEWDWDQLTSEWDIDKLDEWGLDMPVDFTIAEELKAEEDNYEMPDELHTDIVLGDLFEIGEHRLLCGDSTQTDTFEKLFNAIKLGSSFTINTQETLTSDYIFIRARNSEFNYSENPSFISGSTGEVIYDNFINAPQVYLTTIGMYNDSNELVAVAKMSRPLLKDFTKEALVRVKLDF